MIPNSSTTFSRTRGVAYSLLCVSGIVIPFVLRDVGVEHELTWAALSIWLLVGGLACAVGQFSGRYLGEYTGLPFVMTALVGFGGLQLAISNGELAAVPGVAMMWAFGLLTFARWNDIRHLFRSARRKRASE